VTATAVQQPIAILTFSKPSPMARWAQRGATWKPVFGKAPTGQDARTLPSFSPSAMAVNERYTSASLSPMKTRD